MAATFKTLPQSSHDPDCPEALCLGREIGMTVKM